MERLTESEIGELLMAEPEWRQSDGMLVREWRFADFAAAMTFVNRVAAMAEEMDHHPDIDIRYNKVRLGLVSHDAGGLTKRDAKMVARISQERVI